MRNAPAYSSAVFIGTKPTTQGAIGASQLSVGQNGPTVSWLWRTLWHLLENSTTFRKRTNELNRTNKCKTGTIVACAAGVHSFSSGLCTSSGDKQGCAHLLTTYVYNPAHNVGIRAHDRLEHVIPGH